MSLSRAWGECRAHFKEMDVQILERFQEERARDYTEFASRCEAFVQEVEKETQAQHWTFAELEELEGA